MSAVHNMIVCKINHAIGMLTEWKDIDFLTLASVQSLQKGI